MILTCPSCDTQYFADDNTIGDSGRSVKCAACGHSWHVHGKGGVEDDVPVAVAGGAHEAYRERVRERRARRSRLAGGLAWVFTALLFTAGGASAIIFRNDVVRVWPEAASAYKGLGLGVNRFGLDFNSIEPTRTFDGTTPVLTVTGSVINISSQAQAIADVRISLRDDEGGEVGVLFAQPEKSALEPGETAVFRSELQNPPVAAFNLLLSFVDDTGHTEDQTGGRVSAAAPDEPEPPEPIPGESGEGQ